MPAWQGLWTDVAGNPSGHSLLVNKNPRRGSIKRAMNRVGFRAVTELFDTLIGASAGSAALKTSKEVGHVSTPTEVGALGGARTIDTRTYINRNSTAADVTALKEMTFNVKTAPASYARDRSGNGSVG